MNLQQLRIMKETVRRDFNLTDVATALYTSQPGVSKNIKDLEDELGIDIFVRKGKRFLGLTNAGKELIDLADRILVDVSSMRSIAEQFAHRESGRLTIATTHTQARYVLPPVIQKFKAEFPRIELVLEQGSPRELASMVAAGDADLAIATEGLENAELLSFPCYSWRHAVVVPKGHPLADEELTLEAIEKYPLITYQEGYTGRFQITAAFQEAGLSPKLVLSAIDADVIKTYVEIGLGVGIIASMAYHPEKDQGLQFLDSSHLFRSNTTRLAIKRGQHLREYTYSFIELFSPRLTEDVIRQAFVKGLG